MFHITWGAGLCTRFMTAICPRARPVGVATIKAITTLGAYGPLTQGGIQLNAGVWHLSPECVESLDRYVEVFDVMRCAFTRVTIDGADFPARIHLATSAQAALAIISSQLHIHRRGYAEWGFPQGELEATLAILDRDAA